MIHAHHRGIFAVAATAQKSIDAQRRPMALFDNLPNLSAMMAVKRRAGGGYMIPEVRRYRHGGVLSGPGLMLPLQGQLARRRLA